MTLDALAHKTRPTPKTDAPRALIIGELDANIVDCPACRRPLDGATSRCPGCGTRLLAGVRLSKALTFLGIGVLLGSLIGGATIGLAAMTVQPAALPGTASGPIATGAPMAPGPAPASLAPAPGIPAAALSALRQATLLNQRVAGDADRLAAALAVPEPSSAELARILRSLAGHASVGERIAPVVGTWDRGAPLATGLTGFYLDIGAVARDGLGAALGNTTAYLESAADMQTVLAGLTALDADARVLALAADIELPPLGSSAIAP